MQKYRNRAIVFNFLVSYDHHRALFIKTYLPVPICAYLCFIRWFRIHLICGTSQRKHRKFPSGRQGFAGLQEGLSSFPEMPRCAHMDLLLPAPSLITANTVAPCLFIFNTAWSTSLARMAPRTLLLWQMLQWAEPKLQTRGLNIKTSAWSASLSVSEGGTSP